MEYSYIILVLCIGQGMCQQSTTTSWPDVVIEEVESNWFDEWMSYVTTCDNDNEAYGLLIDKYFPLWYCFGLEENLVNIGTGDLSAALENTCRNFDDTYVKCVANITSLCHGERKVTIDDWVSEFRSRICEPGTTNIATQVEKYAVALAQYNIVEITRQFSIIVEVVTSSCPYLHSPPELEDAENIPDFMSKFAERIFRCYRVEMSYIDVDDEIKELFLYYSYLQLPIGTIVDRQLIFKALNMIPRGERRSSVKVFGDPHLYVYKQGYVTCGAPGQTIFLRNRFITITGNNTKAWLGSKATYMTQVEIMFQSSSGYAAQYSAGSSVLPDEFIGGGQTKLSGTANVITLAKMNDNMIRFVYNASGITITLNRIRHTYMMVVRAANDLYDESTGLLIEGCTDEIDIAEPIRRRRRNTACMNVDEELQQFCRFDYSVTGDKELAESVNELIVAEEKAIELDIELGSVLTTVPPTETTTDNGANILRVGGTIVILIFACILV